MPHTATVRQAATRPDTTPWSLEDIEKLLARPKRWPTLREPELVQFATAASCLAGRNDRRDRDERLGRLYAHLVETLPADSRRDIVVDLGEILERFGRAHRTCPVGALRYWLLRDPDFGVVSTAALSAAQLMDLADDDPLTGPKAVLNAALRTTDPDTQAAMVTGLAAMGDARVLSLVDAAWGTLDGDAQSDVLMHMGRSFPTLAGIEFLVSRLEHAAVNGEDGQVGHVVASLLRIRSAVTEAGVLDVERIFPVWSVAEGAPPVRVRQIVDARDVGERVARRLEVHAAMESHPRLIPLALRAWGAGV